MNEQLNEQQLLEQKVREAYADNWPSVIISLSEEIYRLQALGKAAAVKANEAGGDFNLALFDGPE
ncbi:MAG: hypothetical protein HGB21_12895 [Nitrospirae bacterium]|nr:hypothetical protein [Nitrospirota bacterium]